MILTFADKKRRTDRRFLFEPKLAVCYAKNTA